MAGHEAGSIVIPIVAGIGNALMATPMVRQLRAAFPSAKVQVIASTAAMGEPFAQLRGVDVTISGRGALKLFAALRALPIDLLIVPFPSNRWQYNALARRSGARRVIMHSYPPAHRAWLSGVGERIEAKRGIHDVVQNLRLLELLGIQPDFNDAPQFEVTRRNDDAGVDLLRTAGIDERRPFIAVHAGSAKTILAAAKRWPAKRYAELIGVMWRETGWPIVVLEGPDERGVAGEILSEVEQTFMSVIEGHSCPPMPGGSEQPENRGDRNVAAKQTRMSVPLQSVQLSGPIGVAASILKRAKLYVGTDSGLAHLSAAAGTRAVTLFAPADPDRVAPFGNRDLVVKPDKPCSPCFLYPWESTKPKMRCREPYCINEISVEMVMEKVRAVLCHATSS